jgi:alpha-tubulin suppressor-like RCC1 family protein
VAFPEHSWGSNKHGQLGRGTESDFESAALIEALEGETIGAYTVIYFYFPFPLFLE